jgi:hypothetical protein
MRCTVNGVELNHDELTSNSWPSPIACERCGEQVWVGVFSVKFPDGHTFEIQTVIERHPEFLPDDDCYWPHNCGEVYGVAADLT